jgi:hypothetical protein
VATGRHGLCISVHPAAAGRLKEFFHATIILYVADIIADVILCLIFVAES